jgi:hypothetical protein
VLLLGTVSSSVVAAQRVELTIDAPPTLDATARRVREIDRQQLAEAFALAGLDVPARVHISLIPPNDPRASQTPEWIVGRAIGAEQIEIFPDRVSSYPYDSLESVVRHEMVHLALAARAGGRPLPRWFHEGVAVSVDGSWGVGTRLRLLVAALHRPAIADVTRLFASAARPDTADAYLLSAALIEDVRRRHGSGVPGAIAGRVAAGTSFEHAFALETGETLDDATARAWASYRRVMSWVPVVTDTSALWGSILVLAFIAFVVRVRQRLARRRRWEEEEQFDDAGS